MTPLERIQECIVFLEQQLDSLDHYLPETYQFLMAELDLQQRALMEKAADELRGNQLSGAGEEGFWEILVDMGVAV